jgi:similar to stage IV sporulation protein
MLLKLYQWIKGFLIIRLKGQSPERFFNLCSHHNIYLWDVKNIEGNYECNIMLKDYKKLKVIAKKTKTVPYIRKKIGFPFIFSVYKKRKGYLLGLVLFVSIIYMLSLYIWDVSVLGGHTYTPEAMTKFLKENNIYVGVQKKQVDCQDIEELIRLTFHDIGWVSAEIKGTRLIIKITETKLPTKAVTATENRHIIASKDAVITKIVTRTGIPKVDIGSVVKKGDILVSGIVNVIGDNETLVSKNPVIADADVMGKTFYEYKDTFSLNYIENQYTGNTKKSFMLSMFLKKINIYKPRNFYPKYDIIVNDYTFRLNENFYLPFGYSLSEYSEYVEVKKKYTEQEAIKIATDNLNRYIAKLEEAKVVIIQNNVKISINKNSCIAQGKIVVLESIKEYQNIKDEEWRYIEENESSGNNN